MKCRLCRHDASHAGLTTVTVERDGRIVVFREVPAEVCDKCEEPYVADVVAESLLRRAEDAIACGVDVEVLRFAASCGALKWLFFPKLPLGCPHDLLSSAHWN